MTSRVKAATRLRAAGVYVCLLGCSSQESLRDAGAADAPISDVQATDAGPVEEHGRDTGGLDVQAADVQAADVQATDVHATDVQTTDAGVPPSDVPVVGTGRIVVGSQPIGERVSTLLYASFVADNGADVVDGERCTSETFGECVWSTCIPAPMVDGGVADGGALDAGTSAQGLSAGDVVFSTGLMTRTLTPMPGSFGVSYSDNVRDPFARAGDTLTVRASGAVVPAFQVSMPMPSRIVLRTPILELFTPLEINRTEPFRIAWSGGGAGVVQVSLTTSASSTPGMRLKLECGFAPTAGSASIPASLLMRMPAGTRGAISISTLTRSTVVTPSGWRLVAGVTDVPAGAFGNVRFN